MKFKTEQLPNIATQWFEETILSKANLTQQFILSFIWNQGKNKLFEQYKSYLDLLSSSGYFDIDSTKENLLKALDKVGGKYEIPMLGYILDKEDIEAFFRIAQKYSVN